MLGVGVVLAALVAALAWRILGRHSAHPNLLLVTIDTLRADRLGSYGYAQASTPVLDRLARRGARFESALTSVPLTGPAHSTILTGLYPPVHGVRDNVVFVLDPRHQTLATLLKKRGYRTGAFVSAYPVAGAFGFRQGFDDFSEGFHESQNPGTGGAERPANEAVDAALAWLGKDEPGPFFAWLHLYDPHSPYRPPAPYDARFKDRPYDGEIAFADAQLGRVLEWLRASGHDEDTVIAMVADHGESLGEHNEATHAILIYQATLRVPFLLAGPGVPAGTVVTSRVGTVDLLPTVLGLLGFDAPPGLPGLDLRVALKGGRLPPQPLYAESLFGRLNCRWSSLRAWVQADWKLIDGSEPELYNLSEDPSESRNLAADDAERVRHLQNALHAAVRQMTPGGDHARANPISPEQEERLRSLGYTSGSGGAGALDQPGLPDPRKLVHLYEQIQQASPARGAAAERAVEQMMEITRVDPGNPYAQYALGNLAYRSGRLKLADAAYARALDLDPDRPGMRLTYGHLLRDMGKVEESEQQLRIAVEQTTEDDARTRASLAETLIAAGKTEEAASILKDALEKSPNDIEALAAKGRLLVATGRAREAIAYLEKAAAGRDPEPWVEVARAYLQLGEPAKVLEAAAEALRRSPEHPWALAVTGHALILEGKQGEGLSALKKALAAHPRRPDAWLSLAAAFEKAGDSRQAAACRREAAAIANR
jgi:arylsulfatase A-like enzyme/Tfp pilus assembly protein PilF